MEYVTLATIRDETEWALVRAEHPVSKSRFTVKRVKAGVADTRPAARRLKEEFEYVRKYANPRILRAAQCDEANLRVLYEDTQGSLAQLIAQEGQSPPDLVANVLLQAAEGLRPLHEKRQCHGSVSSLSLLMAPDGSVKFAGFVGYQYDPPSLPPPPDFAARYQAPEMLAGFARASPSSDLYCLGFVALEMLAGTRFPTLLGVAEGVKDVNWLGWHADRMKHLPPLKNALPDVPDSTIQILESLTRKEPAQRGIATATDLIKTLTEFGMTSGRNLPALRIKREELPSTAGSAEPVRDVDQPLLVLEGEGTSQEFPGVRPVLIGRGPECDLTLTGSDHAAKHSLIAFQSNGWWVYDLRSTSGTFVNEARVRQHPIVAGDRVRFGSQSFRVSLANRKPQTGPSTGARIKTRRGQLALGKVIHTGVHGAIHQAVYQYHGGGQRVVAVRVFPPNFTHNLTEIRRLLRGNPLAARMKHEHLLKLYGAGRSNLGGKAWWYLVMEYMAGGSLRDRLTKEGPLPIGDVVRCGRDIAAALTSLAGNNVVHRNVQPSGILFDATGVAKLGDFSLLRSEVLETFQQITQSGQMIGEQIYQAPELIDGRAGLSPASDVYGLACCLYEAATGQTPIRKSTNLPDQINRILQDPVPPARNLRSDFPVGLDQVLLTALDKSPGRRYATPAEFGRALKEFAEP